MSVRKFPDRESIRVWLRNQGYRQITYLSKDPDEFWWSDEKHWAAEVTSTRLFIYDQPWMRGFQTVWALLEQRRLRASKTTVHSEVPKDVFFQRIRHRARDQ